MSLVCTFDAFKEYCDEAEENGIEEYALYDWTKSTIENPEKSKTFKIVCFLQRFRAGIREGIGLSLEERLSI